MHESRRQAKEGAYASSRLYRVAETTDLLAATQRHGRLADNFVLRATHDAPQSYLGSRQLIAVSVICWPESRFRYHIY